MKKINYLKIRINCSQTDTKVNHKIKEYFIYIKTFGKKREKIINKKEKNHRLRENIFNSNKKPCRMIC